MGTIKRREFIRTAALACPFLAAGGQIAKGRVVSADRLEGALPGGAGTWRAERKR